MGCKTTEMAFDVGDGCLAGRRMRTGGRGTHMNNLKVGDRDRQAGRGVRTGKRCQRCHELTVCGGGGETRERRGKGRLMLKPSTLQVLSDRLRKKGGGEQDEVENKLKVGDRGGGPGREGHEGRAKVGMWLRS